MWVNLRLKLLSTKKGKYAFFRGMFSISVSAKWKGWTEESSEPCKERLTLMCSSKKTQEKVRDVEYYTILYLSNPWQCRQELSHHCKHKIYWVLILHCDADPGGRAGGGGALCVKGPGWDVPVQMACGYFIMLVNDMQSNANKLVGIASRSFSCGIVCSNRNS